MPKKGINTKKSKKRRLFWISAALLLAVILAFSGTKIYLYVNFILGNDLVVKLDADKRDITLAHGEEEKITFDARAATNPFCTALCISRFIDISRNKTIETDSFTLSHAKPLHKEYTIKPQPIGTGLDLYRFDFECTSRRTVLCHTEEEPFTRSILITVDYGLNEYEKELKESSRKELEAMAQQLSLFRGQEMGFLETYTRLNETLIVDKNIIGMEVSTSALKESLANLQKIWDKQDYQRLSDPLFKTKTEFEKAKGSFDETNSRMQEIISRHNSVIIMINDAKQGLESINQPQSIGSMNVLELNLLVNEFNNQTLLLQQRMKIDEKEAIAADIYNKSIEAANSLKNELKKQALKLELETDINYDVLCNISMQCTKHDSIGERTSQEVSQPAEACARLNNYLSFASEINRTMASEYRLQNYPDSSAFWRNISRKTRNIKWSIISKYVRQLPEDSNNSKMILEILEQLREKEGKEQAETEDYPDYDLKPALIAEVLKQGAERCILSNITLNEVEETNFSKIEHVKYYVPPEFAFEEPRPACCVFGKCEECCVSEECLNDPMKFPVVFLHGHSINKEVSAEYSLEGFNQIQKELEKEGYLNAGAITLFTKKDLPRGVWGMPNVPLTIRASYYFDIFEEPENYITVQAKSESIDTYSIRLKELIELIQYKTGRPKVNIIAFSMGGLVARRYIQIFGADDVDKVILIGTPNKGIAGRIADYCPLVGENLECRDMNSGSLFMNKLNAGEMPDLLVYNIIGTGCQMDGGVGDGAVLKENAFLEGADNYVINGTCRSTLRPLHLELRDITLYPEVYDILADALKKE